MSTKDWLEKDFYASLGVASRRAEPTRSRRPTASSPASCTPTPTPTTPRPRPASSRSRRPTACSPTTEEAQGVRRGARALRRRRAFRMPGRVPRRVRHRAPAAELRPRRPVRPCRRRGRRRRGGLGDLFGGMFGGGGAAAPARRRAPRGRDVESEVTIDFVEAVDGAPWAAAGCQSTGRATPAAAPARKPGTSAARLPACRGTGHRQPQPGRRSPSPSRAATAAARAGSSTTRARLRRLRPRAPHPPAHRPDPRGRGGRQQIRLKGKGQPGERGAPPATCTSPCTSPRTGLRPLTPTRT